MTDKRALRRIAVFACAGVQLIIGLTATFTPTLHSNLLFVRLVVAFGLLALALVPPGVALFARSGAAPFGGVRGLVAHTLLHALAGGVALLLHGLETPDVLTHVLAAWAVLYAVLNLTQQTAVLVKIQDRAVSAGVLLLLAVAVELTRGDQVMLLGFFGAWAIIAAVFSLIAAFDPPKKEVRAGAKPQVGGEGAQHG